MDDSRSGSDRQTRPTLDTSTLPEAGDLVGNLYRLTRLLGKGTFGRVYVAERIDVPEHQVALKLILREMYSGRNVERELVMLAAAGHPNIVQLKDHGSSGDFVWFTMPVYEGETLAARLSRGTLSLRDAYEIFVPIARGIEALHRAGLRHQDLKPDNIYLAQFAGRLHPIILDLGVAAERTSSFVAGTILFASPEQTQALTGTVEDLPLNEKMDTYGLAATLLLSLVGMRHFPGSNAGTQEEMAEAQQERAESPLREDALLELEGRPRQLFIDALQRWFALDAAERSSMTEMAEELEVLLETEREEKLQETRTRARQKAKLQRARLFAAALMVVALGIVGVAYAKRETLRLADQLNQARAEGAASFDRLETCTSAQNIAQADLNKCNLQVGRERADYKRSLEEMSRTGSEEKSACAHQLMTFTSKLNTCEEEAETERKACTESKQQLTDMYQDREADLTEQRDAFDKLASSREAELASAREKINTCDAELASCRAKPARADNPYEDPLPAPRPPTSAAGTSTPPPLPPPPAPVDNPYLPED